MRANLQPFVIERFLGGYYHTRYPDEVAPGFLVPTTADVDFNYGVILRRPGHARIGSNALSGRIQRMLDYGDPNGTLHRMAITTTGLYEYNVATDAWDLKLGGLHGSDDIVPSYVNFFGRLLIVNGADRIIRYNGTTGVADIISTSPAGASAIAEFGGRVLVAGFVGDPTKMQWSTFLDETNWSTGSSGSVFLTREEPIQAFAPFRSSLLIFRTRSIWLGNLLDTTPFYTFDVFWDGLGTKCPGSVWPIPIGVIFMSDDNLYIARGVEPTPVSPGARELISLGVNRDLLGRAVAVAVPEEQKYYLSYTQSGSPDNDVILVYNYSEGNLSLWRKSCTGLGFTAFGLPVTWAQMNQPWSAYSMSWSTLSGLFEKGTVLFGLSDGTVHGKDETIYLDGATQYESIMTTSLINPASPETRVTMPVIVEAVEIVTDPTSSLVYVTLRYGSRGFPLQSTPERSVDLSTGRAVVWFSASEAPLWQVQLRVPSTATSFALHRIVLWWRARGVKVHA